MATQSRIDWVQIGTWLAVGYVAVKYVLPLLSGVDQAAKGAGNIIGDAIAAATLPGRVDVKSGIVFPDGKRIDLNKILAAGTYVDSDRQFVWQGAKYQLIAPRRSDGWFDAKRAP